MATLPVITYSVDQQFYVESLGGPPSIESYLEAFPVSVYSHAADSHLVLFLQAMLGPAGAGLLRQQYLEARLQLEESNVTGSDLDNLYSSPFLFARLAEETYEVDADSAYLIPISDRQRVLSYDAAFRNRAQGWLAAIHAGGTPTGIRLAASSGLGQPVDVVENYQYLYDQLADIPIGLPYVGSSKSLNEIILLPRNDVPRSTLQNLSFLGNPVSGYFTLTLPLGLPYVTINVTSASGVLTVKDTSPFVPGAFLTLAQNGTAVYGQVGTVGGDQVTVVQPTHWPSGVTWTAPADGSYVAYVGQAESGPIPFNASDQEVQSALEVLPALGGSTNIAVTGGPLPQQPISIVFTGSLSNVTVSQIIVNIAPDFATGVGSVFPQMKDANGVTNIAAEVYEDIVGQEYDTAYIEFAPGDVQTMLDAVDTLKPMTSFVTTTIGQSVTQRQPAQGTYARTNYTEVLRYVTGTSGTNWPPVDNRVNWIESGIENEAPSPANTFSSNYVNFHNISGAIAYTEGALADAHYQSPQNSPYSPWFAPYWNTQVGSFNQYQQQLYPFLRAFATADSYIFRPEYAVNPQPDATLLTGTVGDPIGVINNSYPASYMGLPGVQQQPLKNGYFYASDERTSGTDYLEIDLGTTQAVNFIYLEATNKPFLIDVAYDTMDQVIGGQPNRIFQKAYVISSVNAPSVTSLNYNAANTNPWTPVTLHIGNNNGGMIYTRFIRLGFTRNPSGPPFVFAGLPQHLLPYSVEVRNMRIGRNVSSAGAN